MALDWLKDVPLFWAAVSVFVLSFFWFFRSEIVWALYDFQQYLVQRFSTEPYDVTNSGGRWVDPGHWLPFSEIVSIIFHGFLWYLREILMLIMKMNLFFLRVPWLFLTMGINSQPFQNFLRSCRLKREQFGEQVKRWYTNAIYSERVERAGVRYRRIRMWIGRYLIPSVLAVIVVWSALQVGPSLYAYYTRPRPIVFKNDQEMARYHGMPAYMFPNEHGGAFNARRAWLNAMNQAGESNKRWEAIGSDPRWQREESPVWREAEAPAETASASPKTAQPEPQQEESSWQTPEEEEQKVFVGEPNNLASRLRESWAMKQMAIDRLSRNLQLPLDHGSMPFDHAEPVRPDKRTSPSAETTQRVVEERWHDSQRPTSSGGMRPESAGRERMAFCRKCRQRHCCGHLDEELGTLDLFAGL